MTKAIVGALALCFIFAPLAHAEEEGFFKKSVKPVAQFIHQGAWGVATLIFKVGKAPVDVAFETVGKLFGFDPNEPLWE